MQFMVYINRWFRPHFVLCSIFAFGTLVHVDKVVGFDSTSTALDSANREDIIVAVSNNDVITVDNCFIFAVRRVKCRIPSLPLNMKVETFGELLNEAKFPASASFFPRRNIADGVDRVCALEMIDATCMPKCNESSRCYGPTITFEIKPKQGFFQSHPDVRVPYCNNCILQLEKCYSDAFEQMYDFCPLDLFSGDLRRMRCALNALVAVPHHNLRVFVDGTVVHSDEIRRSNEELTQIFRHEYGVSFDQLLTALCCVLAGAPSDHGFTMHRSSVLAKLLRAQRIDTVGIVNAYRIYNRLSHNAQKELLNKCLLPRKGLSFLHKDTDRALIERYLLAATMKDCSLMVSLRLLDPSSCGLSAASSSEQFVQVLSPVLPFGTEPTATSSRECCFAFSINIVDLDPKSPKNLLNAYERFMNGVKIIENAPLDLRRPCLH
ncbi:Inositol-pentakisphosphate 2-kinase [Toxocara canis]|uniref:Inositol-pentakisphosphate 2-kinase n=1 Tax=Toxocara canis TaxID=6265 RepID=A0A0B2W2X0_TOXCA|nr:Inositol-pentakisphosphate 2-kinase [Toxocara canis]